jgi:Protein of unknown function (DUF1194)
MVLSSLGSKTVRIMAKTLRMTRNAIAVVCFVLPTMASPPDVRDVDIELVLAVDISASMNKAEAELQRRGYVEALTNAVFLHAVSDGQLGRIAIAYVEWAGADQQWLTVPWSVIDNEASALSFAGKIRRPREVNQRGTSISAAIDFAASAMLDNGYRGRRMVIDISGDGPNNMGRPVLVARADAMERGITINGLPVINTDDSYFDGIESYYSDCVVGGPSAFLLPAHSMSEFASAIRRKLILEVVGSGEQKRNGDLTERVTNSSGSDCFIGEKLRARYIGNIYPEL